MHILFLTQFFQPEPFFKGLPFAKELTQRGHSVEILTGFPNYPGGKIYPGYSIKLIQREIIDGVLVNRVPLYPSHSTSGLQRILSYISFCFSAALIGPLVIQKPDVIYVYNLPTLGFVARIFKLIYRSKIVLDIQDLWPESVTRSNMLPWQWLHVLLEKATNKIYISSDHITVLSHGFKNNLIARGINERAISVIYNWCNEVELKAKRTLNDGSNSICNNNKFNIVFAGTMGKMQALESVIDAAEIIEKNNKNIVLWFIGAGIEVDNLKDYTDKKRLLNIRFISRLEPSEMEFVLQKADLLLVHLKKDPIFEITIPSKIQAYMHAGKPILVAVTGDAAKMVTEARAGLVCEPESPQSIAEGILKIYSLDQFEREKMGYNGRNYYNLHLSKDVGANKYEELFSSLLSEK